jgi:hypothetical protein
MEAFQQSAFIRIGAHAWREDTYGAFPAFGRVNGGEAFQQIFPKAHFTQSPSFLNAISKV